MNTSKEKKQGGKAPEENRRSLVLAPMAGFTDAPFRLLCRRHGADFCVTEMISAAAMCFHDRKTAALSALPRGDSPIAVQLFGHDEKTLSEAAYLLASGDFEGCRYEEKPSAIDINMGCPVKKVVSGGDGSALMKNPDACRRIAAAAISGAGRAGVPVSVKLRAGWDENGINAPEIAAILAAEGVCSIAVHARTKAQMYAPGIDLSVIKRVRQAVPREVSVIGNGDIACASDAVQMIRETSCDGVMVGRAALGNPWIFEEIRCALSGKAYTPPSKKEIIEAALALTAAIAESLGEERGVREARGRVAHFIRGMRGSAAVRASLNTAKSLHEVESLLNGIE